MFRFLINSINFATNRIEIDEDFTETFENFIKWRYKYFHLVVLFFYYNDNVTQNACFKKELMHVDII